MSDKSPRQKLSKAGKTVKEKRADKQAKSDAKSHAATPIIPATKKR